MTEQENTEKKYWRSKVQIIVSETLELLQKEINEFSLDKFVVGIQYPDAWQNGMHKVAVVSFKVQDD